MDMDIEGFYASTRDGIDFDDVSKLRFPFAPERLDGIDNDGDGYVHEGCGGGSPIFRKPIPSQLP